jgi:hypothetical protein
MAQPPTSVQIAVRVAQYKIFNKLCIAYRRSRQNPAFAVRAEDVRHELAIAEKVFVEALDSFVDANGEKIVEVFEQTGERYLTLGESTRFNLSDRGVFWLAMAVAFST